MHAVEHDEDWHLIARTTRRAGRRPFPARELMREIAEAAWRCADPGVQYDTTINQWHTSPELGPHQRVEPVLPGDARVHTTKGLMPIGELVARGEAGEEIRVYTHRATAREPGAGVVATQPIAFMRNGVKPIVRLRFANGARAALHAEPPALDAEPRLRAAPRSSTAEDRGAAQRRADAGRRRRPGRCR